MIPFLFVAEIEYQNREELAEPTEADIQEIQDAAKKAKEKKKDIAGKRSTSTTIIKDIGVGFVTNCYWGYMSPCPHPINEVLKSSAPISEAHIKTGA